MASAKPLKWVLGARSETGYVRTANEDRMGWTRAAYGDVYVVSDGMGGYCGGALAAELTVHTLQDHLAALSSGDVALPEQMRQAFLAANQAVYQRRRADDPDTRDMGATGVALITSGARVLVGHVGDSRAYLWRERDGLKQLTRDHTRVQKMVDGGLVTPAQAAAHPDASVLDRAIGHQPTVEVDVSSWMTLKPGDMLLLCSDGLSGYVDDAEIAKVLRSKGDPQTLADRLVDCALIKGGEDNVTVQLVRFGGPSSTSMSNLLGKPAVLLPIAAVMSATVALVVATTYPAATETRIGSLQSKLDKTIQTLENLQKASEDTARSANLRLQELTTAVKKIAPSASAPTPAASAPPKLDAQRISLKKNEGPKKKSTASVLAPATPKEPGTSANHDPGVAPGAASGAASTAAPAAVPRVPASSPAASAAETPVQ